MTRQKKDEAETTNGSDLCQKHFGIPIPQAREDTGKGHAEMGKLKALIGLRLEPLKDD